MRCGATTDLLLSITGGYANGPAMVGKYELASGRYWEIALPEDYNAYGHFTMDHQGNLVCDGYFKYPWEIKKVRDNSTDNGSGSS